jgi:hypothetical protein
MTEIAAMGEKTEIRWRGSGRWLSFVLAGLLIVLSIPLVFDRVNGAAAGWNIFLGLLLFGTIASNQPKAPVLALIMTGLMGLRFLLAVVFHPELFGLALTGFSLTLAAAATYDLRKQAARLVITES